MESWDIRALDVEPHHPEVLHSDDETRAIAISLPSGELLQEHETHEHAYLLVVDGEVEIEQDRRVTEAGSGFLAHFRPGERREVRARSAARIALILAPWPGEGHPRRRS